MGDSLIADRESLDLCRRFSLLFPDTAQDAPFYEAALADRFDVAYFKRATPMPRAWRWGGQNKPIVAVMSDAAWHPSDPPEWRAASDLARWAEITVTHREGEERGHYLTAMELAKTHMRVLVVETAAEVALAV